MTITSLVVINSKYRTTDSRSTSDFTYSIGQSIEVSRIAIKSISIPHLQYNINATNNRLRVLYASSFEDISIPYGQYDIAQLMSALQTAFSTAFNESITIAQDTLTSKLTITTTSIQIKISTDLTVSPLSKVLGFGTSDLPDFDTVVESPYLHNLSGLKNYYVSSRILSQGYNGLFRNGIQIPLITNVPINQPYGFTVHYDSQDIMLNMKSYNRPQNIQLIDIKILDEDLNVVDLNGADVEIVLKIYTEKMFNKEK